VAYDAVENDAGKGANIEILDGGFERNGYNYQFKVLHKMNPTSKLDLAYLYFLDTYFKSNTGYRGYSSRIKSIGNKMLGLSILKSDVCEWVQGVSEKGICNQKIQNNKKVTGEDFLDGIKKHFKGKNLEIKKKQLVIGSGDKAIKIGLIEAGKLFLKSFKETRGLRDLELIDVNIQHNISDTDGVKNSTALFLVYTYWKSIKDKVLAKDAADYFAKQLYNVKAPQALVRDVKIGKKYFYIGVGEGRLAQLQRKLFSQKCDSFASVHLGAEGDVENSTCVVTGDGLIPNNQIEKMVENKIFKKSNFSNRGFFLSKVKREGSEWTYPAITFLKKY
jgi:hypothetical protein